MDQTTPTTPPRPVSEIDIEYRTCCMRFGDYMLKAEMEKTKVTQLLQERAERGRLDQYEELVKAQGIQATGTTPIATQTTPTMTTVPTAAPTTTMTKDIKKEMNGCRENQDTDLTKVGTGKKRGRPSKSEKQTHS